MFKLLLNLFRSENYSKKSKEKYLTSMFYKLNMNEDIWLPVYPGKTKIKMIEPNIPWPRK